MKHMNFKKLTHRLALLLLLLLFTAYISGDIADLLAAEAKVGTDPETNSETVALETIDFRILATGDLHGQVTAYNYETNEPDNTVGLSKIYTLVKKERLAVGRSNTLLLDAGDCLYDYSTNYLYNNEPDTIQPIYQAMQLMGYDYVTLGNHDFDYPWDYLYQQLEASGMLSKTLVCNAVYTESGENVFRTSAIITKKAKTSNGRTVSVKIGVVGATKASLSTRRYRYSGFIDGLDIYTQVKKEAAALKEQGADIVIAVIHGGVGLLSGADTTVQAGVRLAKLADVDAVLCSHSHETFPSADGTYSKITGVDENTGLVYGTPVVETGSHANALGVINFTLAVDEDGKISIQSASSSLNPVKASTKENSDVLDLFSDTMEKIQNSYDPTEYPIADGLTYTNADCLIQDSNLYQLMNDAKMNYAASYIADYAPEYASYPIVAVTVNYLDNKKQTIQLSGSLTENDLAALVAESSSERSNGNIRIHQLSGSNLIEWLEYSASIYGTVGTPLPELLESFSAKNPDVSNLTRTSSTKDWSTYFAFDGISYDIDLTVAPRYNANGNLINYTRRVKNLTWNGQEVTSDMTFLIVMDSLKTRYKFMPTDDSTIYTNTTRLWLTGKEVLMEYIKSQTVFGSLSVKADNNWHLIVPEDYSFIAVIPKENHEYVMAQPWCQKLVKRGSAYYYYLGTYMPEAQQLHAVLSPGILVETNRQIPIQVLATAAPDATVTEVLYLGGNVQSATNSRWDTAGKFATDNAFIAKQNGRYSVRVTDSLGNMAVAHIYISNHNSATLEPPRLNVPTNRLTSIKGNAVIGSTIHVALPDGTIATGKTEADGTFAIEIPLPRAYDLYTVWATKGKYTSLPVEITAKKTGANRPSADPLLEGATLITGKADPYVTLSVRLGSRVYVGEGEKKAYQNSSVYKKSHKLTETTITYGEDGTFSILLPEPATVGQTYYLYATDRNGNASRIVNIPVEPGPDVVEQTEEMDAEETDAAEQEENDAVGQQTENDAVGQE